MCESSCVVSGMTNNRPHTLDDRYAFRVCAYNAAGEGEFGAWSAPCTTTEREGDPPPAPRAPSAAFVADARATVAASWQAVRGASAYKVFVAVAAAAGAGAGAGFADAAAIVAASKGGKVVYSGSATKVQLDVSRVAGYGVGKGVVVRVQALNHVRKAQRGWCVCLYCAPHASQQLLATPIGGAQCSWRWHLCGAAGGAATRRRWGRKVGWWWWFARSRASCAQRPEQVRFRRGRGGS